MWSFILKTWISAFIPHITLELCNVYSNLLIIGSSDLIQESRHKSWELSKWVRTFFFFLENQDLEKTLLNQSKSFTRIWWSSGGTSSIHTIRASICLTYWAKLWARELPNLWVCENLKYVNLKYLTYRF